MKKDSKNQDSFDDKFKLLTGEEITFDDEPSKTEATDEIINQKYVKGDIRIVTETARYSLAGILSMLQETVPTDKKDGRTLRYKLDPEYQRRHRWGPERKSRLIESFLMNVPVPPVFLYETELARFEVMDGRQRLNTLSEFYANKLKLKGLQYWTELDGRTYKTLPSKVRDGIDRRYISSIILLKETARDEEEATQLKKMVFERLNSGGVKLSHQETRNAVYDGPLNKLCFELSKNSEFRAMWGIPSEVPPDLEDEEDIEALDGPTKTGLGMYKKMKDVELVLRFFAYRQIESFPGGLNRINALLDRFLKEGNKFGEKLLSTYKEMFEATISFINESIGQQAFCKMKSDGKPSGRPTKFLYDPLMYVASTYSHKPERSTMISGKEILVEELVRMYAEHDKLFSGRSTNIAHIRDRNAQMKKAFREAFNRLKK